GGCTSSIEAGLSQVDGVSHVSGDPETKVVEVEYDETALTSEAILAKLDEIGFAATIVG
ncbi:MAG: heavy-metal-associated domain-containing protein, partial [Armatimonadetes bacterium]|nr:heavy-metal-associated domain-containing protein [Armatimonadota bacterium]